MIMSVVFPDNTYFIGDRKWHYSLRENRGILHFKVLAGSDEFSPYIGYRLAVPITAVKFFEIMSKQSPHQAVYQGKNGGL